VLQPGYTDLSYINEATEEKKQAIGSEKNRLLLDNLKALGCDGSILLGKNKAGLMNERRKSSASYIPGGRAFTKAINSSPTTRTITSVQRQFL
jgi:hypothetical protein